MELDPSISMTRDRQTATPDGRRTATAIAGVVRRSLAPLEDHRGRLMEIARDDWAEFMAPAVSAYAVTASPGSIRGWVVHHDQADRLVCLSGVLWWALYDARPESPTYRTLDQFVVSEHGPVLLVIPAGVCHAVKNIGASPTLFVNMPTRPYDYEEPDKFRFPMDGAAIPFVFPG